MAVGSGIGGSFGISTETVAYGTYVAPVTFRQVNKAEIKKVKNTVQGGGLAASQLVQRDIQRVVTTEAATGSFELEVARTKMGVYLQHIMGSSTNPVQQASTAAYLQTHALGDPAGKYFTGQLGVPDRTGTVRPQTGKGGKVTSAEFACKVNELLMVSLEADFQKYSEVETLATPSYVDAIPFHWQNLAVKVGATYGSEAAVSGVKGVSCKLERGLDTDAFYAGAAGLKAEPVVNDWAKISGSLDVDFLDKTVFSDRFHADTGFSLVLEWVGPIIASTYAYTFRIKLPKVFLDGDTQNLEGNDVVSGSFPFVAQYDGTNPAMIIEYISTDVTLP